MDPAYLSPIVASFAAAPQVAAQQAAGRARRRGEVRRRRVRQADAEPIERPVEGATAVDAIGEHGDDARRRDKNAGPPQEPREHVDVLA